MTRSRLLVGLASVFAGITAVMIVVASVYRTPVPLAIAVPFGITGYLLWYQGTGRLEERMRRRARRANAGTGQNRRHTRRQDRERRAGRRAGRPSAEPSGPSRREAYRILDLDPGADDEQVKRAYRERVKRVHPDRGGDEEEFRRVKNAYERLNG